MTFEPPAGSAAPAARPRITWRSVLLGVVATALLAGWTPVSDLLFGQPPLTGSALPVGVVGVLTLLVLGNGLWRKVTGRRGLHAAEMGIVLLMMLVGTAVAGRGLMQGWPGATAASWYHVREQPAFGRLLTALELPDWFFPHVGPTPSPSDRASTEFVGRTPRTATWDEQLAVYRAWVPPLLGWGVFFACVGVAALGLSAVTGRQWIENERVPFPLAQVHLALLEEPPPGRALNATLTARTFWIGFGAVVAVRCLSVLHAYVPRYVPELPMQYNLRHIFTSPPMSYIDGWVSLQVLYPIVIAVSFLAATRITFSIWAFVLLMQIPAVLMQQGGASLNPYRSGLNLGAVLAVAGMVLFSGRGFYAHVIRSMLPLTGAQGPSGSASQDKAGRWVNAVLGWAVMGGAAGATAWLAWVGMPWGAAAALVASLLLIWVVMSYVVAHSGLQVANTLATPHEWFSRAFGGAATSPSLVRTQYFAQLVGGMWAYNPDHVNSRLGHSLKVLHETETGGAPNATVSLWRPKFIALGGLVVGLALVVGYFSSAASTLWLEYGFASDLSPKATFPINADAVLQPKWAMEHATRTMEQGLVNVKPLGEAAPVVGGSAAFTGLLAFLQLRVAWWPLHPIGYLMVFSYPVRRVWFSVLLGWLLKSLTVKFGGSRLLTAARPLVFGVILGEVMSAGLYCAAAPLLYLGGIPPRILQFLPVDRF